QTSVNEAGSLAHAFQADPFSPPQINLEANAAVAHGEKQQILVGEQPDAGAVAPRGPGNVSQSLLSHAVSAQAHIEGNVPRDVMRAIDDRDTVPLLQAHALGAQSINEPKVVDDRWV